MESRLSEIPGSKVKESNLKGVLKKIVPSLMDDFEGFKETVEHVTSNIEDFACQLDLEAETEGVTELLESHNHPLSDKDQLTLEEQ